MFVVRLKRPSEDFDCKTFKSKKAALARFRTAQKLLIDGDLEQCALFDAGATDADWHDAEWCERHGLYSRLFDTVAEMDAAIEARAQALAASNPEAVAKLKRIFWAGTENWDQLLAERAAMSGTLVLSEFTRSAIAHFKAK